MKYLFLILILIFYFGAFSFCFAQETTNKEIKIDASFFNSIIQQIKDFGIKAFNLWKQTHQKIIKTWKQKILPLIQNWLEKRWSLLKIEFEKEIQEMKQEIRKIFIETFFNLWQWLKNLI